VSLLRVRDLVLTRGQNPEARSLVEGLSFSLMPGESLGLVGESGSGKSLTAQAIMGQLPDGISASGLVEFEGRDLGTLAPDARRALCGPGMAMIFQDPMTSLNPYRTIGAQMIEGYVHHRGASRNEALAEARRLLDAVRVSASASRLDQYPHQLSGGQRQRVMIATALMLRPKLLVADEPTTALDVTVQQQILRLLGALQREFSMALLLITHDLGVVTETCTRTLVLYAGQMMEYGPTEQLLRTPSHPYTWGLLHARVRLDSLLDEPLPAIPGAAPSTGERLDGCRFAPRCEFVVERCHQAMPPLGAHQRAVRRCWRPAG